MVSQPPSVPTGSSELGWGCCKISVEKIQLYTFNNSFEICHCICLGPFGYFSDTCTKDIKHICSAEYVLILAQTQSFTERLLRHNILQKKTIIFPAWWTWFLFQDPFYYLLNRIFLCFLILWTVNTSFLKSVAASNFPGSDLQGIYCHLFCF